MARNIKKQAQSSKDISYSSRDFESLRSDLRRYVQTYFSEAVKDTTDASLAGMFIDLAAYVGDVTSYYLDHQFNENSLETAVEPENLERLIRESGLEIPARAPASGFVDITLTIPAALVDGEYVPRADSLPKVMPGTIFRSKSGTLFYLTDAVDFGKTDSSGELIASFVINNTSGSVPVDFLVTMQGFVISSKLSTQSFTIPDSFQPFRSVTLTDTNVNEIVRVVDSDGDDYFEVSSLTQGTVFKRLTNSRADVGLADQRLQIAHAPKRFIKRRTSASGKTTLIFGGGREDVFDEDVIPDPSEHALRLFGDRKTLNKITIDPNSFLGTQTLGISPRNTEITVTYRSGGGLNHNVRSNQIVTTTTLVTEFSTSVGTTAAALIRASVEVNNPRPCLGGDDEPTLESLRQIALLNRNSQNRIVTREDLIARVYSLPSNFGRVFRASVRDNPNNPQAAQLYILSRDSNSTLILSPDALKLSLSRYLSKFRLVSDAIDILDASIINIGLNYTVTIKQEAIPTVVIAAINGKLSSYLNVENYQIDQPIKIGEVENLILNTPDVEAVTNLTFVGKTGTVGSNIYSNYSYDPGRNVDRGFLFPPVGGIFELKYPGTDLVGRIS
jgi:hypothetical protein